MKKSQALAALALAFALGLGVVAPVANTYARITPNDATEEEKDVVYENAKDALREINYLDNYTNYKNLYNAFEGENGLVAQLDKIAADQLKDFNTGLKNKNGTNSYIKEVSALISRNFAEPVKATAPLKEIKAFTGTYETLQDAYNAIETTIKAAQDNVAILTDNYDTTDSRVSDAIDLYNNILWDLEFNPSKTPADESLLHFLNAALNTVLPYDVNISDFTNTVKAISEDAYDEIVENSAWVASPTNAMERAADFGLIIKAAQSLPKYELTGAVVEAEAKVLDVLSPVNGGATIDVSYENAQAYVEALNNAVIAFESGKTPVEPDNPDQPTDPTPVDSLSYGNVTVKNAEGFAEGISLVAEPVKKDIAAFGKNPYALYDIHFVKTSADIADPKGPFTVEIKAVEGVDFAKSNIYYVAEDGKVEKLASTYTGNSLTFTVDHFSLYAVAQDRAEANVPGSNNEAGTPNTGIAGSTNGTASSTIAIVAGLATTLTAAGAGVVAYRNARRSGEEA